MLPVYLLLSNSYGTLGAESAIWEKFKSVLQYFFRLVFVLPLSVSVSEFYHNWHLLKICLLMFSPLTFDLSSFSFQNKTNPITHYDLFQNGVFIHCVGLTEAVILQKIGVKRLKISSNWRNFVPCSSSKSSQVFKWSKQKPFTPDEAAAALYTLTSRSFLLTVHSSFSREERWDEKKEEIEHGEKKRATTAKHTKVRVRKGAERRWQRHSEDRKVTKEESVFLRTDTLNRLCSMHIYKEVLIDKHVHELCACLRFHQLSSFGQHEPMHTHDFTICEKVLHCWAN